MKNSVTNRTYEMTSHSYEYLNWLAQRPVYLVTCKLWSTKYVNTPFIIPKAPAEVITFLIRF